MGLSRTVAIATSAPTFMVVASSDGWQQRIRTEAEIRRRGWRLGHGPAAADVFVTCGTLAAWDRVAVERTWEQLPGPRARGNVATVDDVDRILDASVRALQDEPAQRGDAASRETEATRASPHGVPGRMSHGASPDHGRHEHEGHDHGDMSGPGGVPLASGGEDRDGLDLDVLHLHLGPVLTHWPPGESLTLALQGDVVVGVERHDGGLWAPRSTCTGELTAWHWDWVATTLALAGAQRWAAAASRLCLEALLDDGSAATAGYEKRADDLLRRVGRSRILRWSLSGVGVLEGAGVLRGDAWERLLAAMSSALNPRDTRSTGGSTLQTTTVLERLLVGGDIAAARLAIASVAALGCLEAPLHEQGVADA